MQAQHIRGYYDQKDLGLDYSRLMVVSCDAPGRCDIRAMSYVINAHLRRHDTFRSRFSYAGDGPDRAADAWRTPPTSSSSRSGTAS